MAIIFPNTTPATTTATTTTVQDRDVTKINVSTTTSTQSVGNFVTDISIQPYIANRIISFYAYNMRPSTKVHIFFDGINVDQYCAPSTRNAGNNYSISTISDTSDFNQIPRNGSWGAEIWTDGLGSVAGQFNVPASTFKVGERILQILDVEDIVTGNSSYTTSASAKFTASNISITKQEITLTTISPELSFTQVSDKTVTQNVVIKKIKQIIDVNAFYEPLAQALTINTPAGETGIYATSLDIYFRKKPSPSSPSSDVEANLLWPNGVTVYLCETTNGYPDGDKILPFSTTHLNWNDIVADYDGQIDAEGNVYGKIRTNGAQAGILLPKRTDKAQLATKFTFEAPVFLNNNRTYAFIVRPDNNDQQYQVWTANLGDTDVETQVQMFSQPVIGTAFYGATMKQWTALPTEYVKFLLRRAEFTSGNGAVAVFQNSDIEYLPVRNLTYVNASAKIIAGDYVFQSVDSETYNAQTGVKGIVSYYDAEKSIIYTDNSTGNWSSNGYLQVHRFAAPSVANTPNSSTIVAHANTAEIFNPVVDALVPQFSYITPAGTALTVEYTGTSNSYVVDTYSKKCTIGYENEFFDIERIVASKTNEVNNMGGQKSFVISANLVSDSSYLSPIIDMVNKNHLVIENKIDKVNEFNYGEFLNNANTSTKYVSKPVTLADGQDAQDLQVTVTAYRPVGTNIQVWVKFVNGQDAESIDQKTWTPLLLNNEETYSSPGSTNDLKELNYVIPKYYGMIDSPVGTITCTNASANIVGTNTSFTTDLQVGWYVNMKANSIFNEQSRKIVSIANDVFMTLDQPFVANYTDKNYYLVVPPTTAFSLKSSAVKLSGKVSTSVNTNVITGYHDQIPANTSYVNTVNNAIIISQANTYYQANDAVLYLVPAGNSAIGGLTGNSMYYVKTSNSSSITLSATPGGATLSLTVGTTNPGPVHTISKTNFLKELNVGDIINVAGDRQGITSISNSHSLTVGSPWSSAISFYDAYTYIPEGLMYFNNDLNRYSSFKKFQIKVVLQADDSSKVPILHDLRAIALQL